MPTSNISTLLYREAAKHYKNIGTGKKIKMRIKTEKSGEWRKD